MKVLFTVYLVYIYFIFYFHRCHEHNRRERFASGVVFRPKPNSFDSVSIHVNGVDISDVNTIIEEDKSKICQDLPNKVNFSICSVNRLNDNYKSGREIELNEDEPFTVTFLNRKKIRGGWEVI